MEEKSFWPKRVYDRTFQKYSFMTGVIIWSSTALFNKASNHRHYIL
jgi:hypothetical protein